MRLLLSCVSLGLLNWGAGCRQQSEAPEGAGRAALTEVVVTAATPTAVPAPEPVWPGAWARGKWAGSGTASPTKLVLPGNQGVQIAWLKDKGQLHSGAVEIDLDIDEAGVVTGKLSGALGALHVTGIWAGKGALHLDVRPQADGPEAFHGTLALTMSASPPQAAGVLRAASGDGKWVREATLSAQHQP